MLSINTNLQSLIAQNSLKKSTFKLNQAVERMSTGYKLNHAKDNAANYSISTNMNTKISAYQIAEDNVAMGLDMLNTANDSLNLISDKLSRLRALAEQAANGTYGVQSLKAINSEATALVDEIERSYSSAEYNDIKLFGETGGTFIEEVTQRDTSAMTTFKSVDENAEITSGTYSISTAEELAKLSEMSGKGKIKGGEFVLANNIDLSAYSSGDGWKSIHWGYLYGANSRVFDGNGYVISNLYSSRRGLFSGVNGDQVKNLGIENAKIIIDGKDNYVGILSSGLSDSSSGTSPGILTNCYVTGSIDVNMVSSDEVVYIGGLVGYADQDEEINSCYANVDINAIFTIPDSDPYSYLESYIGGLAGSCEFGIMINSYATGSINAYMNDTRENMYIGGLVAQQYGYHTIENSYSKIKVDTNANTVVGANANDVSGIVGYQSRGADNKIINSYYDKDTFGTTPTNTHGTGVTTVELNNLIANGTLKDATHTATQEGNDIILQVGINAGKSSQIDFNPSFNLTGLSALRQIGQGGNCLNTIDELLNQVTAKQTEYGAVQNRLESALDEISTQYENLISSRSTLKDADIAKVSSEYIQQQILQQASATLLATANQTPALALQLL